MARGFLDTIRGFQRWMERHGHSVAATPSAGNICGGLYNITLKSLGSAAKKHPQTRLEHVIRYAEPLPGPGLSFMNSPGNDLESISGQVAAGANLVFFSTGSGSVANFPFVPTVKFISNSARFNLLCADLDVNAGRLLDGNSPARLTAEVLEKCLDIASGVKTAGERAGISQVCIWREWQRDETASCDQPIGYSFPKMSRRSPHDQDAVPLAGTPLATAQGNPRTLRFRAISGPFGPAVDQVGLILPVSLCAAPVARQIAAQLNEVHRDRCTGISRFAALIHTEGCGSSVGASEQLFVRSMISYLTHPNVAIALLLEHGCERTHNDFFRHVLAEAGLAPGRFGWASVQLDGGTKSTTQKARRWFDECLRAQPQVDIVDAEGECLTVGLLSVNTVSESLTRFALRFTGLLLRAGVGVVLAEGNQLLAELGTAGVPDGKIDFSPTLAYGQRALQRGLHVMEMPSRHTGEILAGLGAAGAQLLVVFTGSQPVQAHPLIPMIQIGSRHVDLDFRYDPAADKQIAAEDLMRLCEQAASRRYSPRVNALGMTAFQISRGSTGISV